jgi:glycine cleavage system aminomethyltransferase T
VLDGDEPTQLGFHWHAIEVDGRNVGHLTNCVWSYRLKRNIGFALISADCVPGMPVTVQKNGRPVSGTLRELPFIGLE